MRVDKFLWFVRLYKTRSIATNAIKNGKVKVNGDVVKPSREVYPLDELTVRKDQIDYQIQILDYPKSRVGAKLVNLYIVDKTPKDAFEAKDLLKYSQDYYRKKGAGRPTKKDRRDIDDWFEEPEKSDSENKDN